MSSGGEPQRVLHFVSGGFSGATQVAVDLARAAIHADAGTRTLLVLRRKRATDGARVQALRDEGLAVEVVPGALRAATLWALVRLCRRWRPDVLVAHGFPEHLIGRWAGWLAGRLGDGGPRLVQVEHNSRERYGPWTRWQARWLARRSAALVGVSEGVRRSLLALGAPPALTRAIPNGIDLARFATDDRPWSTRDKDIVMSARFARQKDHATLLRALALLRERHGLAPRLTLAGAGSARYRGEAERLCAELELGAQVDFAGH
ncbi:MAG TPA: glycosyltransferase, partial [Burkholderiaceae bacterium]|nr:glycosyltransferase [Burkholderiaceae bacterium]